MASGTVDRAVGMLVGELGAEKVVSAGPAYDGARHVWNAAVTRAPAAVVLCGATDDVRAAVRAAAACGVSLSVRGGGHDWAGRAVQGDLVVDLSRMDQVVIEGDTAVVGGGATSMRVAEEASARGFAAVTGIIGSVGMAGLTMGGGYGHLTGRFGLALDNLLGAEIVLSDGRAVEADAAREPDLFWAVRGGGGNYGVATRLRLKLHTLPDLSDGTVTFPWDQADDVLTAYHGLLDDAPDALGLMPTFAAAPDGTLSLVLHHAWCGAASEDERMVGRVAGLGRPTSVQVERRTLAGILHEAEKRTMSGIHWIVRTVTLPRFTLPAIAVIKDAMERRSSPLSWIAAHPFYGAGERVPLEATAFGIRQRHFMVGIYTAWQPGDGARHRLWSDAVEAALRPHAIASSYPNYFGPDRPDQAAQAYGPNAGRLLDLKRRYDPHGMFSAISLPLAG